MTAQHRSPAGPEGGPEGARAPLVQFQMALGLYLLWGLLAWLGAHVGAVELAPAAVTVLLGGAAATNALFFGIARAGRLAQPPAATVAAAQAILGLAWASLFSYLAKGGAEIAFAMFLTIVIFALFQVGVRAFFGVAALAGAAYVATVTARTLLVPGGGDPVAEPLLVAVFLGVLAWLVLFGHHVHALRRELQDRNAELRVTIEKVSRVAERDHLTKSFNRHYIMETLAREKGRADRSNVPVSVCIFDLDHFKSMNDEHGHLVGDRILKGFAKRVRAELRGMDAVNPNDHKRAFGRFGGEEFIAILPSTGINGARRAAERIRESVAARPFDDCYSITVSVGVAEYRRGETVPELLTRADEALYRAKAEGRNCVVCCDERPAQNAEIRDLHAARP